MRDVDLEKVEKVLGFPLNEEQLRVLCAPINIFRMMTAPEKRITGSTTAAILKMLLSVGGTIDESTEFGKYWTKIFAHYSGDDEDPRRYRMFCMEVIKIGQKLNENDIDIRHFVFRNTSTKEEKEKPNETSETVENPEMLLVQLLRDNIFPRFSVRETLETMKKVTETLEYAAEKYKNESSFDDVFKRMRKDD